MKQYPSLLILLLLTACGNPSPTESQSELTIFTKVNEQTAKILKAKRGLVAHHLEATGTSPIQTMTLNFDYFRGVSIDQARELLVSAVHQYLAEINTNSQIRPFLDHYPVEAKDVEIQIFIYGREKQPVPMGGISILTGKDGLLSYEIRVPEPQRLQTILKEPYEQALRIVAPSSY